MQIKFDEVRAFFGLPNVNLVEKDRLVVCAIGALAKLDASPFALVFGGGTALARAHKVVQRMSEDVDFKIVPQEAALSRSRLRQPLGNLRESVTANLQSAGFIIDPPMMRSRNENRYTIYQIPYARTETGEGLRPTIQIELTYAALRLPTVMLPVSSFVTEASGQPAEAPEVTCVSLAETAAEKIVSLTRRTAMDLAGLSRDADPALVRHIYDLHMMHERIDPAQVCAMAAGIARSDAEEFRNQYPAYHADITGETRKALNALKENPVYRVRYKNFIADMVYGEQTDYDTALETVIRLASDL